MIPQLSTISRFKDLAGPSYAISSLTARFNLYKLEVLNCGDGHTHRNLVMLLLGKTLDLAFAIKKAGLAVISTEEVPIADYINGNSNNVVTATLYNYTPRPFIFDLGYRCCFVVPESNDLYLSPTEFDRLLVLYEFCSMLNPPLPTTTPVPLIPLTADSVLEALNYLFESQFNNYASTREQVSHTNLDNSVVLVQHTSEDKEFKLGLYSPGTVTIATSSSANYVTNVNKSNIHYSFWLVIVHDAVWVPAGDLPTTVDNLASMFTFLDPEFLLQNLISNKPLQEMHLYELTAIDPYFLQTPLLKYMRSQCYSGILPRDALRSYLALKFQDIKEPQDGNF